MTYRSPKLLKIASERISILFELADCKAIEHKFELADRYAQLARRISTRYNIRLPREHKRKICKSCNRYLLPGVNLRVRTYRAKIIYRCLNCNRIYRLPFYKERYAKFHATPSQLSD